LDVKTFVLAFQLQVDSFVGFWAGVLIASSAPRPSPPSRWTVVEQDY